MIIKMSTAAYRLSLSPKSARPERRRSTEASVVAYRARLTRRIRGRAPDASYLRTNARSIPLSLAPPCPSRSLSRSRPPHPPAPPPPRPTLRRARPPPRVTSRPRRLPTRRRAAPLALPTPPSLPLGPNPVPQISLYLSRSYGALSHTNGKNGLETASLIYLCPFATATPSGARIPQRLRPAARASSTEKGTNSNNVAHA